MKKLLLLILPVMILAGAGGAAWWAYGRNRDSFTKAQEMMDKGDLRGAQLELRNAIRTNPNNAAAHFRLGQVGQRLGDAVAAEKELKLAREQGFDARLVNPILAQAYMAQGRYRELLRDFPTQGLSGEQATPLLTLRSLAQLSLGDLPAALAAASEAERLTPTSTEATLTSARVLIGMRDFQAAEAKVDRALQINPRAVDALVMRGQLLNVKGDRTRAIEAFDTVLSFNANNLTARLERANLLLMDGKDARAKEDVEAALKLEPRSSMGTYLRAVIAVKAEDYAAADVDLTKIASLLARFPRGFFFYAITKYNLGQAEQASDAANKYLARNPSDPDAIKLFSRIELAARRPLPVISLLTASLKTGIADADLLDLLGRAYALAGKPDIALDNMERAAALAPANADILVRLASLRLSLGYAGRAAGEFERVLDLDPTQAAAAEQLVLAAISAGEIDRASLGLARLRKIQGESESVGNLGALIRMAQLDLDGALALLTATTKNFPEATQPRINLAKVLVLKDRAADAQLVLAEVLDRKPNDNAALGALVNLLNADSKPAQALARLEKAHATAPKDPDITLALANQQSRLREPRKALALVDEVLKDQPGNTALLTAKARFLAGLGQSDEAEATYRRVLDENPLDMPARRAIADLRVAARDATAARSVLADGLRADPGNAALMQAIIIVALRFGDLDAALAEADRLNREPANLPNARWLRGDAMMAAGRFIEAVSTYSADFRAEPGPIGLGRLISALNASGRADQATQILREWLSQNPEDDVAADLLASLDLIARRFFEAEKQLGIVLKKRPSDGAALNNIAWVYQQRNDARARPAAQKAYILNPTPEAADTLGWILVTTGNPATGLTLLRQAASQLGRDPTVIFHLAVALKDTGRKDEAIAALKSLVDSIAEFDDRPAATRLLAELNAAK